MSDDLFLDGLIFAAGAAIGVILHGDDILDDSDDDNNQGDD